MELTQLIQFREVARQQNITRAAETMYISQPALSKSIKLLETELGAQLFDRKNNRIYLNLAGEVALAHIENALSELQRMRNEIQAMGIGLKEITFYSQSASCIRHFIPLFQEAYSDLKINTMVMANPKEICSALLNNKADIGFSFELLNHSKIRFTPIGREQLGIILPKTHAMADRKHISIREIDGWKLYCFAYPDDSMIFVDRLLEQYHVNITRELEKDYFVYCNVIKTTKLPLIGSTMSFHALDYGSEKVFIPFKEKTSTVTYYINYVDGNEQRTKLFSEWVKNNYALLLNPRRQGK